MYRFCKHLQTPSLERLARLAQGQGGHVGAEQLRPGVAGLGIWHRWYRVKTATGDSRVDTVMLSGNGGQKVYLVPSLDLVAVFTGGSFNAESPMNADPAAGAVGGSTVEPVIDRSRMWCR